MKTNRGRPPFFDRVCKALEEGIQHARGEISLRTTTLRLPDRPPKVEARAIARLRERCKMSQFVFASVLNVSVKTVQSWEQGNRKPSQAALRLLEILSADPTMADRILTGKIQAG